MKSKYPFQLTIIIVFAITAMAFFENRDPQKQCGKIKGCCNKNCKTPKQTTDNSENIFYNPVNTLIAAVYK
jgi:hypothetical protein